MQCHKHYKFTDMLKYVDLHQNTSGHTCTHRAPTPFRPATSLARNYLWDVFFGLRPDSCFPIKLSLKYSEGEKFNNNKLNFKFSSQKNVRSRRE